MDAKFSVNIVIIIMIIIITIIITILVMIIYAEVPARRGLLDSFFALRDGREGFSSHSSSSSSTAMQLKVEIKPH